MKYIFSFIFSFILFSASAQENKSKYDSTDINQCVSKFDSASVLKKDFGYQFWFADKKLADGKTIKLSVVNPGQSTHLPHQHEEDEFFFILEGTAEFYLNGKVRVVGANSSLYCPSWSLHGLRNVGDVQLKYLVIKKYLNL